MIRQPHVQHARRAIGRSGGGPRTIYQQRLLTWKLHGPRANVRRDRRIIKTVRIVRKRRPAIVSRAVDGVRADHGRAIERARRRARHRAPLTERLIDCFSIQPLRAGRDKRPVGHRGVRLAQRRAETAVVIRILLQNGRQLPQVSQTLRRTSSFTSLTKAGENKGDQNRDDRNHHQQFNEREAPRVTNQSCAWAVHRVTVREPGPRGCCGRTAALVSPRAG